MTITDRDRFLILSPLMKALFLPEQGLAPWWPDNDSGRQNMQRRLNQLVWEQLLVRHRTVAQVGAVSLFYHWAPGMPAPDFGARAWELGKRWERVEPKPVTFYGASDRAAKRYGRVFGSSLKSPAQLTHELGLGSAFLKLAHHFPLLASAWIPEVVIARQSEPGEKVFDAYIVDSRSTPAIAIDFAGPSYAASNGARLRELHECAAEKGLPYEIWTITDGGSQ
jgi:hypothetical protein